MSFKIMNAPPWHTGMFKMTHIIKCRGGSIVIVIVKLPYMSHDMTLTLCYLILMLYYYDYFVMNSIAIDPIHLVSSSNNHGCAMLVGNVTVVKCAL